MHFQHRNMPIHVILRVNKHPTWPDDWRETFTIELFTTHKGNIGRRLGHIDLRMARRVIIENRFTHESSIVNYQFLNQSLLGESLSVCHFILHKLKKGVFNEHRRPENHPRYSTAMQK